MSIKNFTKDEIMGIANSVGLAAYDDEILQFAIEMQALTLIRFAEWCRSGERTERVFWGDVATNAELCSLTVDIT